MKRRLNFVLFAAGLSTAANLIAAENLRLNPRLDYSRVTARTAPSSRATTSKRGLSAASRIMFLCSARADSIPGGRLAAPSDSMRSIRGRCIL